MACPSPIRVLCCSSVMSHRLHLQVPNIVLQDFMLSEEETPSDAKASSEGKDTPTFSLVERDDSQPTSFERDAVQKASMRLIQVSRCVQLLPHPSCQLCVICKAFQRSCGSMWLRTRPAVAADVCSHPADIDKKY